MAACFVPDAVHYFPSGTHDSPFRGARTIAERWQAEIRAYYASPQDPSLDRQELTGYDYAAAGYATTPPA